MNTKRKKAQNVILWITVILLSPVIIPLVLAFTLFIIFGMIIFTPIGIVEWADKDKTDHPIGYLLDWMFPKEEENDVSN